MKTEYVRILVVDGDPEIVSMLVQALSPKHSVVGITGGSQLVEWVAHREFDLVLLDILLPDSNGLALLAELKSAFPSVSVIVMTGMNTPPSPDPFRRSGLLSNETDRPQRVA